MGDGGKKMVLYRIAQILQEDGPLRLFQGIISFLWCNTLRGHMPNATNVVIDEVYFDFAPAKKLGDRLFLHEGTWRYSQGGEIEAHFESTRLGDVVQIIGGGYGLTTVHAARQVGKSGSVTVFEGGQIASHVRRTARLNDVDDVVTVEEAIIGDPTSLYQGVADDVEVIDPADLPACDVLEMDCEGSELGILEGMQIRPRVLIVELHPTMYDAPNAAPVELIEGMGYEMTYWSTQAGERMSEEEFRERLAEGCGDVLAAVRE